MDIDSTRAYRSVWFCFRILAPTFFGARSRRVYVYMGTMQFMFTFLFPVHLLLGLLLHATPSEFFHNLTISTMCVACSLKHIVHLSHLKHIKEIEELFVQLDACILSEEGKLFFQKTLQHSVNRILHSFYLMYGTIYVLFVFGAILSLWNGVDELLYLAWFPFDWRRGGFSFALAYGYQFFGIIFLGLQGWINDIYTPLALCHITGHIHLFGTRMSRLGYEKLPGITTQQQLLACFEDFKLLMRLHQLIRETISNVQLTQLVFCGANLCLIISYILFYVRDAVSLVYHAVLFGVVLVQLFPGCYFATLVAEEVTQLPYAIFSGNWYEQTKWHRKNVLIFMQLLMNLKRRPMMAGGLFKLNLNTFLETLKMAYSMFAVVCSSKM